jgi:AbrB family transcriptional regulator (stage V sporulation protein T)
VEGSDRLALTAAPILAAGDVCGAVLFLKEDDTSSAAEADVKLISAAASFLGRQMEE